MPVLINESEYTSETIDNLSEEAKSAKMLITLASVYGFWAVVALGGILTVAGLVRANRS
jgi:hypothetical protein